MNKKFSYKYKATSLDYVKTVAGVELYIHHWGTGYQMLEFISHFKAGDWWSIELKRLKAKEAEVVKK